MGFEVSRKDNNNQYILIFFFVIHCGPIGDVKGMLYIVLIATLF